MLDRPEASTTRLRFRRIRFALPFIVVALVIAIPAILLKVSSSCGCAAPPDLAIINYAREDVSVSWQGQGLFGTGILGISGNATASACTTHEYTLHPGLVDVSVRTASDALSVRLDVPGGEGRVAQAAVIIIGADGRIAQPLNGPPPGGYPDAPLCNPEVRKS